MQKKNIFKALAFAMLMPAMLLTTACSSEDDLVNNTAENTVTSKGYALPVTVNVTRQGDATTRATYTYDEGTKKGTLSFSDGDKLFVWGIAGDYDYEFAGELTWQSGETFSGTIYINNEWTDTADALFTAASAPDGYVNAALLPAGYESYGFLTIEDYDTEEKYDDVIRNNNEYTLATSKADGVAQFSYEEATSYSSGFELEPQNAILNFTITGLAASTNVAVSLTSSAYNITRTTVTTDAFGTATFAAGVSGVEDDREDLNDFTLTVDGNAITLVNSSTELAAGKIYNIARSAAPAPSYTMAAAATTSDKGKLICTAGHIHVYGEDAACTAGRVAKIIYVGSTGHATYNHGLALALEDMSTSLTWDDSGENNDGKTAAEWCSAWNTSKPVTDADWLLASQDQWNYMMGTNGADSYTALRDGFTSVGGDNLDSYYYWSRTEVDELPERAWRCSFSNGKWGYYLKNVGLPVRACLAF